MNYIVLYHAFLCGCFRETLRGLWGQSWRLENSCSFFKFTFCLYQWAFRQDDVSSHSTFLQHIWFYPSSLTDCGADWSRRVHSKQEPSAQWLTLDLSWIRLSSHIGLQSWLWRNLQFHFPPVSSVIFNWLVSAFCFFVFLDKWSVFEYERTLKDSRGAEEAFI